MLSGRQTCWECEPGEAPAPKLLEHLKQLGQRIVILIDDAFF
jgi:hypothetical protein